MERNWPQEKNFWKRKCNHQPSDGCFPEEMLALPSPHFPSVSARQSKKKRRAFPRKKTRTKIGSSLKTEKRRSHALLLFLSFFPDPGLYHLLAFLPFFLLSFPEKVEKKIFIPLLHRSRRLFIFLYASGDAPPERRRRQQGIHKEKPWASSSPLLLKDVCNSSKKSFCT